MATCTGTCSKWVRGEHGIFRCGRSCQRQETQGVHTCDCGEPHGKQEGAELPDDMDTLRTKWREKTQGAHYINLEVRRNGASEVSEAEWLRRVFDIAGPNGSRTHWNYLRPEVQQFALEMEAILRANDLERGRDGWHRSTPRWLLRRVEQKLHQLKQLLTSASRKPPERWKERVVNTAADVGNFAMMVSEVSKASKR